MKKIILYFALSANICALAQVPAIQWQKSFGGSNYDNAACIKQTSDGGYIVAGSTESVNGDVTMNHGLKDCWVVKLNGSGILQWQKSFGGTSDDVANSISQTSDGGFILAGYSYSNNGDMTANHGSEDFWVAKLDASGSLQWQKSLGGTSSDIAKSVIQTPDGGYLVAGTTYSNDNDVSGAHGSSDGWLVKLDTSGVVQWQKAVGGTVNDRANYIQNTSDGGYVMAGSTFSNDGDVSVNHGSNDSWIVKLSVSGAIQWQKTLGGTNAEEANSIEQTTDGGYVLGNYSYSNDGDVMGNHGSSDCWVVKTDSNAVIEWQKSLGGSGDDIANTVQQTTDGGFIMIGNTVSNNQEVSGNHGLYDVWIIMFSQSGVVQWLKTLGGTGVDFAANILQTTDGGYALTAYTGSHDGDVTSNHGQTDYWVVKLNGTNSIYEFSNELDATVYPNPVKDIVNININASLGGSFYTLNDVLGNVISKGQLKLDKNQLNMSGLKQGVYFLQINNNTDTRSFKVLKE